MIKNQLVKVLKILKISKIQEQKLFIKKCSLATSDNASTCQKITTLSYSENASHWLQIPFPRVRILGEWEENRNVIRLLFAASSALKMEYIRRNPNGISKKVLICIFKYHTVMSHIKTSQSIMDRIYNDGPIRL